MAFNPSSQKYVPISATTTRAQDNFAVQFQFWVYQDTSGQVSAIKQALADGTQSVTQAAVTAKVAILAVVAKNYSTQVAAFQKKYPGVNIQTGPLAQFNAGKDFLFNTLAPVLDVVTKAVLVVGTGAVLGAVVVGAGATEAAAVAPSAATTSAQAVTATGYTSLTSQAVTAGLTGTTGASAVATGAAIVSPVIASDAAIAGVGMSAADLATTAGTVVSAATQVAHAGTAASQVAQVAQVASKASPLTSALGTASNAAIDSSAAHLVNGIVNSALKPAAPVVAPTPAAASSPWLTPAVLLAAAGLLFEFAK